MWRNRKIRLGCAILLLPVLAVCLLIIFHNVGVLSHQATWSSQEIANFNMVVHVVYLWNDNGVGSDLTFVVRDGMLYDVIDDDFSQRGYDRLTGGDMLSQLYEHPVNLLFYRARICFISCHIEYDATYGFPTIIRGGDAIRTDEYEVLSFEIIDPN